MKTYLNHNTDELVLIKTSLKSASWEQRGPHHAKEFYFLGPMAMAKCIFGIFFPLLSTPHFQHTSRQYITGLYVSLRPYQYLPALLQGYHAPHLSSLSPTKFPLAQHQDLNQMLGGKQLDITNSHCKLLPLFLAFSLLSF